MENTSLPAEDELLSLSCKIRFDIIKSLTSSGIPQDPDNVKVLLSALKDMDSQAISRKRIKVEEKVSDNQEKAASIIAHILSNTHSSQFIDSNVNSSRAIPILPSNIIDIEILPGETEVDAPQQDYDSFMASVNTEQ
jgi:hypothetical protein